MVKVTEQDLSTVEYIDYTNPYPIWDVGEALVEHSIDYYKREIDNLNRKIKDYQTLFNRNIKQDSKFVMELSKQNTELLVKLYDIEHMPLLKRFRFFVTGKLYG